MRRRHRRRIRSASSWRWPASLGSDLLIRTGGEQRISNFLLWNLAYTELYFCDTPWPDFDERGARRRDRALQPRGNVAFGLDARAGRDALMLRERVITALIPPRSSWLVIFMLLHVATMAALALLVVAAAWEWSAFPRFNQHSARISHVALVAACVAATWWSVGVEREESGRLIQAALLWWVFALVWVTIAPAQVNSRNGLRVRACWCSCRRGLRWRGCMRPGRSCCCS